VEGIGSSRILIKNRSNEYGKKEKEIGMDIYGR